MTILDDTLPAKVLALVAKYGKVLTFYNNAGVGAGTYSAAAGEFVSIPAEVTWLYKTSPPQAFIRKLNETATVEATLEVTLPASGLDATFVSDHLQAGMRVDFDSTEWRTVLLEPLYSGNQIAAYRLGLAEHSNA